MSDVSSPCVVTCGRERYTMLVTKAVEVASMHPQPCPHSHRALCSDNRTCSHWHSLQCARYTWKLQTQHVHAPLLTS